MQKRSFAYKPLAKAWMQKNMVSGARTHKLTSQVYIAQLLRIYSGLYAKSPITNCINKSLIPILLPFWVSAAVERKTDWASTW